MRVAISAAVRAEGGVGFCVAAGFGGGIGEEGDGRGFDAGYSSSSQYSTVGPGLASMIGSPAASWA
jgi:hypothetical protein